MKDEKTGWRDKELSERHRVYFGYDCPAVDLDLVLVEYNHAEPSALAEYKLFPFKSLPDLREPNYEALRKLADRYSPGALPFLIVPYIRWVWAYRPFPGNLAAMEFVSGDHWLSEREYVRVLYHIRGNTVPAHVERKLSNIVPSGIKRAA